MTLRERMDEARKLAAGIGRPVRLMEVCGTHTVASFQSGLRSLLPAGVTLLSGPGCPVCVTPTGRIDAAIALSRQPGVRVAVFGDMIRVPGTEIALEGARATGGRVRVVYSPLDAFREAETDPATRLVFFGVGFETTAPAVAWTIREARRRGLANYGVLCAHKTMPRAMAALLSGDVRIDGFLCPGHVSVITGAAIYDFIGRDRGIPCVVAGFEGGDMAEAIVMLLRQLAEGRSAVEIQYTRSVCREGNAAAQAAVSEVFEPCEDEWRGLGRIPVSGLRIRPEFAAHDASAWFPALPLPRPAEPSGCLCGAVLRGISVPPECPLFAVRCTPETPVGACMVSREGTCSTYYRFRSAREA